MTKAINPEVKDGNGRVLENDRIGPSALKPGIPLLPEEAEEGARGSGRRPPDRPAAAGQVPGRGGGGLLGDSLEEVRGQPSSASWRHQPERRLPDPGGLALP